jgi:hypothetical protein
LVAQKLTAKTNQFRYKLTGCRKAGSLYVKSCFVKIKNSPASKFNPCRAQAS